MAPSDLDRLSDKVIVVDKGTRTATYTGSGVAAKRPDTRTKPCNLKSSI